MTDHDALRKHMVKALREYDKATCPKQLHPMLTERPYEKFADAILSHPPIRVWLDAILHIQLGLEDCHLRCEELSKRSDGYPASVYGLDHAAKTNPGCRYCEALNRLAEAERGLKNG